MKILYQCEICKKQYQTEAEAEICEAQGYEQPTVKVGDYVQLGDLNYGRFGWYDGDSDWVKECPNGLHSQYYLDSKNYSLIYIVTAITHDNHIAKIHLATLAMSEESGKQVGFTRTTGHWTPHTITVDKFIGGENLIGITSNRLI